MMKILNCRQGDLGSAHYAVDASGLDITGQHAKCQYNLQLVLIGKLETRMMKVYVS